MVRTRSSSVTVFASANSGARIAEPGSGLVTRHVPPPHSHVGSANVPPATPPNRAPRSAVREQEVSRRWDGAVLYVASTRLLHRSFVLCTQGGTRIPAFKILMVDGNVVMAVEPDSLIRPSGGEVDVIQVHLDRGESNPKAPGMTQQVS